MSNARELAELGGAYSTGGYPHFKNRIINGSMMIDQRNAGASVTPANGAYTLDRWIAFVSQASKLSVQQNAGSVTPPAGFKTYLGATVGASANVTLGASDYFLLEQSIEGFNTADLGFGAAGASTVTVSFWVRSSLTGTFGGAIKNSAVDRSYPFSFTISSANTWEQKSVTIAGDTSGTWVGATNGIGLRLAIDLGSGSSTLGTASAWASANYSGPTGLTNLITTNSATFYITGVQLEKGSTATAYDYRPYGTELALCQRYYEQSYAQGTAVGTNTSTGTYQFNAASDGGSNFAAQVLYKVTKRNNATVTAYLTTGTSGSWNYSRSGAGSTASVTPANYSDTGFLAVVPVGATWAACQAYGHWTASAEL